MKYSSSLLISLLAWSPLYTQNCGSTYLFDTNREIAIQQWIATHHNDLDKRTTVTIPVVVHVVWRLPSQLISEEQILSQIAVLNNDFRALNEDLSAVPEDFQEDIADLEFEFCLAQQDPDGQPTNGITYTQTTVSDVGTTLVGGEAAVFFSALGGRDAWDTEHYLNIWVCERGFACGEGIFPNQANPEKDGVVIRYDCFGTTGTATPPYHLGRTTTHEIGHYFNLLHVWGSGINDLACLVDDMVEDTPRQAFNYMNQCPIHPQMSCGSLDMFMNYMNLSDDACLNLFTNGQKDRVWAALNLFRSGLLESNGCEAPLASTEEKPFVRALSLVNQPTQNTIHLRLENTALLPLNTRLFRINGQLVHQEKWVEGSDFFIDCVNLNSGLYVVVVENQVMQWNQKVIISY